MAATQSYQMFYDAGTTVGTVALPPTRAIYNGTTRVRDAIIWTGSGTSTSGGNLSINLTVDGTTTGASLFSSIYSVSIIHANNTTSANFTGNNTGACFGILRGYTAGLKSAAFLIIANASIGLSGGNTFTLAPAGQLMQVTVIGAPL